MQWLDSEGASRADTATLLTDSAQTVKLIGAFAWHIKLGQGINNTKHPGAGTVAGCIKSAALWLKTSFS